MAAEIELFRAGPSTFAMFCSKCNKSIVEGDPVCCEWAWMMFNKYILGNVKRVA